MKKSTCKCGHVLSGKHPHDAFNGFFLSSSDTRLLETSIAEKSAYRFNNLECLEKLIADKFNEKLRDIICCPKCHRLYLRQGKKSNDWYCFRADEEIA